MSLKAKLEAVIYAAEEPVTLAQLGAIFAEEALAWKAEKAAAVAGGEEPSAEPAESFPLLDESLIDLGLGQTAAFYATEVEAAAHPAGQNAEPMAVSSAVEPTAFSEPTSESATAGSGSDQAPVASHFASEPALADGSAPAAEAAPAFDPEADEMRQARRRDREVRAVLQSLIDELIASYASDDRGFEIREIAGGYRMATKPECHDAVRQFVRSLKPPLKLSLPALETLAVVAYKQPVTAPEVSEIRGVESAGTLGSLLSRKLIATAGRKQVIGRPILYKTTREFLLRFGLKDVSELPSMEEFEKMAAIELDEQAIEEGETGSEGAGDEQLEFMPEDPVERGQVQDVPDLPPTAGAEAPKNERATPQVDEAASAPVSVAAAALDSAALAESETTRHEQ
jgi:segregation and condensation protein B